MWNALVLNNLHLPIIVGTIISLWAEEQLPPSSIQFILLQPLLTIVPKSLADIFKKLV